MAAPGSFRHRQMDGGLAYAVTLISARGSAPDIAVVSDSLLMDEDVVVAFVGILPQLILVVVGTVLGVAYRRDIANFLDTRVAGLSAFGIRLELRPTDVAAAVADRLQLSASDPALQQLSKGVVSRARRNESQLAGRTILWVDDHQEWLVNERSLVRRLGMFVEPAISNQQAAEILQYGRRAIDVMISDIKRDDRSDGRDLLAQIAPDGRPPLIFYVADVKPDPPRGSAGITNRPDQLLHLIMDAVERLPDRG